MKIRAARLSQDQRSEEVQIHFKTFPTKTIKVIFPIDAVFLGSRFSVLKMILLKNGVITFEIKIDLSKIFLDMIYIANDNSLTPKELLQLLDFLESLGSYNGDYQCTKSMIDITCKCLE